MSKAVIKIIITVIAIIVAGAHLIYPNIKIDAIAVTLLIVAIIPWLEPLFKSVELPGGLKVEFQELKKIEVDAKKAGLIKERALQEDSKVQNKNETYSFLEVAEKNQELALVGFRIEIEKRLRDLANKYSIETNTFSILSLIKVLGSKDILSSQEMTVLRSMIQTLNHAAHGMEYDQRNADWVIENGPKILESLDEKLEIRGGRFSVGRSDEKGHWIDSSFANCHWTTNVEWGECIQKHTLLWETELLNIYDSLLKKLKSPFKDKLIETQNNWRKQFEMEKEFIFSFDDLQRKIGREGMFVSAINFMNKIRERALELEEILNKLA
jgi:uncharacterized protein YecT (DUF1311 family)